MALPSVDMQNSCCKKERCLSGPNAGQVYDVCDPCQGVGTFNALYCDCLIGEVQARVAGGTAGYNVSGMGCDFPSPWQTVTPEPYIDLEGRSITYGYTFTEEYGCSSGSLSYENCGNLGLWPETVSATKLSDCGGGSNDLFFGEVIEYVDGVENRRITNISFRITTNCIDGGQLSHCREEYPVGTEWTANIEYRVSDGQGGWTPM